MAVAAEKSGNAVDFLKGKILGWSQEWLRTLIFIAAAAVLILFVLYPLGILFHRSLVNFETGKWSLVTYFEDNQVSVTLTRLWSI